VKLSQVLEELVQEKGLDKNLLSNIVVDAMFIAYKKKYPDLDLKVTYNKKTDEIEIKALKKVVNSSVENDNDISLRKARFIEPSAQVGEIIEIPFNEPVGRIEILKAKQLISQKIKSIEALNIYKEFKNREGSIIQGVIYKCEYNGILLKIDDNFGFLPKSLMIPTDKCVVGYPLKALLKEVLVEPKNENQLILDRVSAEFVKKLFELEVPEIFEKLVEIKSIVRSAGYKTKMIVISYDKNIDPVGTCVGIGGARIKAILRELGNEKMDIIPYSHSKEDIIKNALKPAEITKVDIIDDKNAKVFLNEDQRSVAIGKNGKNIILASQLVGLNIELITNS